MPTANDPNAQPLEIRAALPACPTNQQIGLALDSLTLKALLARSLTAIAPDGTYRFCPAPDCPTVYYRSDGQQVFSENDLRERVYQKHPDDPGSVVCYCFGHTLAEIWAARERGDADTLIAHIQSGIQAGQCACDIRNPQGTCCLGNTCPTPGAGVRALIDRRPGHGPSRPARAAGAQGSGK